MLHLRPASESDAAKMLAVYSPYVLQTPITFDYEVPTLEEYTQKIRTITSKYPWIVLAEGEEILGFAYASDFRHKVAYQWSAESTIYLAQDFQSKGAGKILYSALFDLLRMQGYVNLYAGVTVPNEKSTGLHLKLGFTECGYFQNIGYKFGQWQGTQFFHLNLQPYSAKPSPPMAFPLVAPEKIQQVLADASVQLNKIKK